MLHLQLRAIEDEGRAANCRGLEQQVRKLQSAMERSDHQRTAPECAKRFIDPQAPEAIKAQRLAYAVHLHDACLVMA